VLEPDYSQYEDESIDDHESKAKAPILSKRDPKKRISIPKKFTAKLDHTCGNQDTVSLVARHKRLQRCQIFDEAIRRLIIRSKKQQRNTAFTPLHNIATTTTTL
jgi:hypothetical protein